MKHISDPKAANVNIPAQTPSGRIYQSAPQVVATGTPTKVNCDAISADFTDGIEDVVNKWILPGVAGYYLVIAQIFIDTVTPNKMFSILIRRGVTAMAMHQRFSNDNFENLTMSVSDIIKLTAIQYVNMEFYHTSGVDETLSGVEAKSYLSVQRVR